MEKPKAGKEVDEKKTEKSRAGVQKPETPTSQPKPDVQNGHAVAEDVKVEEEIPKLEEVPAKAEEAKKTEEKTKEPKEKVEAPKEVAEIRPQTPKEVEPKHKPCKLEEAQEVKAEFEAAVQELSEVTSRLQHGASVEELNSAYEASEFPKLQRKTSQMAMLRVVERMSTEAATVEQVVAQECEAVVAQARKESTVLTSSDEAAEQARNL